MSMLIWSIKTSKEKKKKKPKPMKDFFQMNPQDYPQPARQVVLESLNPIYPYPLLQLRQLIAIVMLMEFFLSYSIGASSYPCRLMCICHRCCCQFLRPRDVQACVQFYFQVAPSLDCCWDSSQEGPIQYARNPSRAKTTFWLYQRSLVWANWALITPLTPNPGNYNVMVPGK